MKINGKNSSSFQVQKLLEGLLERSSHYGKISFLSSKLRHRLKKVNLNLKQVLPSQSESTARLLPDAAASTSEISMKPASALLGLAHADQRNSRWKRFRIDGSEVYVMTADWAVAKGAFAPSHNRLNCSDAQQLMLHMCNFATV
jgi:hypothetical protein